MVMPGLNRPPSMRVGVHTGSKCISGVVGTKSLRFCLLGETVDMAEAMEQGGNRVRIMLDGAVPEVMVDQTQLRKVLDAILEVYRRDDSTIWDCRPDGTYALRQPDDPEEAARAALGAADPAAAREAVAAALAG